MRHLLPLILILAACGCAREWSLPPLPGTGGGCTEDEDCTFGICGDSGACDYYRCHNDGDCECGMCHEGGCDKDLCEEQADCQFGACYEGHCDQSRCAGDDDCDYGRCVDFQCDFSLCVDDTDCSSGICLEGECDLTRCHDDGDCSYGVCHEGNCDATRCRDDNDCTQGVCNDEVCDVLACRDDSHCSSGLCVDGSCDSLACHDDDDCFAGMSCVGGSPTDTGTCVMASDDGPVMSGDPTALRMDDNLEAAVAWVEARHPEAFLVRIVGMNLKADGTVDITDGYSARWMYAWQDGDGQTAPAGYVTVTYLLQGGATHGLYDPDAGNVTDGIAIPESTWRAYRDASELAVAFQAAPSCAALVADGSDMILYDQTEDGPRFYMSNWKGQSYSGDPVTGEGEAYCEE